MNILRNLLEEQNETIEDNIIDIVKTIAKKHHDSPVLVFSRNKAFFINKNKYKEINNNKSIKEGEILIIAKDDFKRTTVKNLRIILEDENLFPELYKIVDKKNSSYIKATAIMKNIKGNNFMNVVYNLNVKNSFERNNHNANWKKNAMTSSQG